MSIHHPAVVFDLDGTLIDSAADIACAINLLLEHFGYTDQLNKTEVIINVGNGAKMLIKRVWESLNIPISEAELEEALAQFQRLYYPICSDNSSLYEGVLETLAILHKEGWKLAICTNKPELHAKKIMLDYGLDQWISYCCGGDTFKVKKPDPKPLLESIQRVGSLPNQTWFVGDSQVDQQTASAVGCEFIFLSFGYHNGYQPDAENTHISHHFRDILNYIQ